MAPHHRQVFDVGSQRLRYPQAVECQQTRQRMVTATADPRLHQEHAHLVSVQRRLTRLVGHSRAAHMRCRGMRNQLLFGAVPVEPRDRRQPPSDRRVRPAGLFQPPCEQLDVGTTHLEEIQVVFEAPLRPLPQIQRVRLQRLAGIARQKATHRHPSPERIKPRLHHLGHQHVV